MKCLVFLVGIISLAIVVEAKNFNLYDLLKVRDELAADNIEIDSLSVPVSTALETHNLFIPMTIKTCSDGMCQLTCQMLGYKHGSCVSSTTCHCYN